MAKFSAILCLTVLSFGVVNCKPQYFYGAPEEQFPPLSSNQVANIESRAYLPADSDGSAASSNVNSRFSNSNSGFNNENSGLSNGNGRDPYDFSTGAESQIVNSVAPSSSFSIVDPADLPCRKSCAQCCLAKIFKKK